MADETIAKILVDQNNFMKNLLEDQKGFLQTMVKNSSMVIQNRSETTVTTMVPTFHGFVKEQNNWESYMQQLT